MADRREFLRASAAMALTSAVPADLFAQAASPKAPASAAWDAGSLRHILPGVSDTRFLIKTSFNTPLAETPTLHVGGTAVRGRMGDTHSEHWHFYATDLKPDRPYRLSLVRRQGTRALRALGARDLSGTRRTAGELPPVDLHLRRRPRDPQIPSDRDTQPAAAARAYRSSPQAVVANGDHVYWDLLAPVGNARCSACRPKRVKLSPAHSIARRSCSAATTKRVLKRAAGPQIVPVYGTDFRSTPVFFMQDDHDYFDNDEATDEAVTFPPSQFMLSLARATQNMYYPEFLQTSRVRSALPFSSAGDRVWGISESFGTIRYGRLAELCSTTCAGPRRWPARARSMSISKSRRGSRRAPPATEITHVVHVPSNPPGWTAGKWGEWYPDVLGDDGKLTVKVPKPYWQPGWLKQHDRLMEAIGRNEAPRAGGNERRPPRDRRRADAALGRSRLQSQSDHGGPERSDRLPHRPERLAVRPSRHRRTATGASRHGRDRQADRAARFLDRRFRVRSDDGAPIQVGLENAEGRGHRHAGAIPDVGVGAAALAYLGAPSRESSRH